MKLYSLPYLVQIEILANLNFNSLFFLSLCSKKTNNFIVNTQKYQLRKVERVVYRSARKGMALKIVISGIETPIIYLYDTTNDFSKLPHKSMKVNELGGSIDFFRCSTMQSDLHARCCFENANFQSTIETILNHLYALLGSHTKNWLTAFFPRASSFFPVLRNIQLFHIHLDLDPMVIDELLSRSTCLECVFWMVNESQHVRLRENSRLYEMDTVYLWASCSLVTDFMKNFNGRHAFLISLKITTTEVVEFLNAWKSGEKFRNMEVIIMDGIIDDTEIRRSVEFKEVDTEVEYSYSRKFPEQLQFPTYPYSWELKSHSYMVRESDGHVATVMLSPDRISMGVWNMTESEFLAKF